ECWPERWCSHQRKLGGVFAHDNGGMDFYTYVQNRPTSLLDPRGLAIWICDRRTRFSGFGGGLLNYYGARHVYLWNDKTGETCGLGEFSHREAPELDSCRIVNGSDPYADKIMACCNGSQRTNALTYYGLVDTCISTYIPNPGSLHGPLCPSCQ